MIGFWVGAAFLAAGAAALMLHRASRARRLAPETDPSLAVYRRALAEIDELAERALLPADEVRSTRAEAARRLFRAADRSPSSAQIEGRGGVPLAATGIVAFSAFAIYLAIGSPDMPDQPFAARLAAWRAQPERAPAAGLAAVLAAVATERPDDAEPLQKLAALDLSLGDADGAVHALRRALSIAPARADLAAMLGEVMVLKGRDVVDPDAHALFERALRADPGQPAARYYLARAKIADGNVAGGLADWRALMVSLPVNDARRTALAGEIAGVEKSGRLGVDSEQGAPSAADLSGAIRGMVDGLAARLHAQPDDPTGWVRLVRAYAVLGETRKRDEALSGARTRYAGRPDVLAALAAAAGAGTAR